MGSRVQTKTEDRQPAEGKITVRRPDALVTRMPVLIDGQHRLVVVTEYHDGTVTLAVEGAR